ncbi:MAG: hypothetical protein RIS44_2536 [Pseudomonadota bacterium]|jgi:hypothetical protein
MQQESKSSNADRRKLLWDLSSERRNQARHSETLRSSVAGYVIASATAVIAVITYDKHINVYDLPLCISVIIIGVVGSLFSATYTERYHRNRRRASRLLKELDESTEHPIGRSVVQMEKDADSLHFTKRRFSLTRSIASSHWLWLAFPVSVAIIGLVLSIFAISCGTCAAPKP